MYSLVMMAALSTAPEATEFNGFFRDLFSFRGSCSGCNGCTGSQSQSASCSGSSCCGGGWVPGSRIRAFFNRGGCCGGCYGSCTGSRYSCCGGGAAAAYSCSGGMIDGYPMMTAPPVGDPGPPFAVPGPTYYGPVASVGCMGYAPGQPFPPTPTGVPLPATGPTTIPSPGVPMGPTPPASVPETAYRNQLPPPAGASPNRATVVVRLPADARLYAENRPLNQANGERTFVTPELPPGREYTYTFRVEYDRAGRTITESKRLAVRPGGTATLAFEDILAARPGPAAKPAVAAAPPAAAAPTPMPVPAIPAPTATAAVPAPAKITVTLPERATLYIDKKKDERTDRVREYTTPPLPPGKEFAYWMTVEQERDGRPEYVYQKVAFRAGATVAVDFTRDGPEQRAGR
jgi:uncharacterized protein (TIGR03000 family)